MNLGSVLRSILFVKHIESMFEESGNIVVNYNYFTRTNMGKELQYE